MEPLTFIRPLQNSFFFVAVLCGMESLSSLTRGLTHPWQWKWKSSGLPGTSHILFFFKPVCLCTFMYIRFLFNFKKKNAFIYLFICGCAEYLLLRVFFSSCGKQEKGLLTVVASLVAGHGLWAGRVAVVGLGSCASWALSTVMAHRPSCFTACGIFPDQGLNLCLLHLQADSSLLSHQGNPPIYFLVLGYV